MNIETMSENTVENINVMHIRSYFGKYKTLSYKHWDDVRK